MDPALTRHLASLKAAGVRRIPRRDSPVARAVSSAASTAGPAAAESLAAVATEIAGCSRCGLCETRQNTVPGEGHPQPAVVFVGEGPGADEDRSGRPFVGAAGQLLDSIITRGMGLARSDVFICNVVKCRPPRNRDPSPEERSACNPFLERQLLALAPKVICTLGRIATQHLLKSELRMGQLRGAQHEWRGIPVIPTYHPSYLLRTPSAKQLTWEDIQRVMELAARA